MERNEPRPCLHGFGECKRTRMAGPYWYMFFGGPDEKGRAGHEVVKRKENEWHGGEEKHFNLCGSEAI